MHIQQRLRSHRRTSRYFVPASRFTTSPFTPSLLAPGLLDILSSIQYLQLGAVAGLCMLRPRVPTAHSWTRRRGRAAISETSSECTGDHLRSVAGESSEGPRTGGRRSGSRLWETQAQTSPSSRAYNSSTCTPHPPRCHSYTHFSTPRGPSLPFRSPLPSGGWAPSEGDGGDVRPLPGRLRVRPELTLHTATNACSFSKRNLSSAQASMIARQARRPMAAAANFPR